MDNTPKTIHHSSIKLLSSIQDFTQHATLHSNYTSEKLALLLTEIRPWNSKIVDLMLWVSGEGGEVGAPLTSLEKVGISGRKHVERIDLTFGVVRAVTCHL